MTHRQMPEHDADDILREWAREHHVSLRAAGIIDQRRERTIREREIPFASFFASRRRARNKE